MLKKPYLKSSSQVVPNFLVIIVYAGKFLGLKHDGGQKKTLQVNILLRTHYIQVGYTRALQVSNSFFFFLFVYVFFFFGIFFFQFFFVSAFFLSFYLTLFISICSLSLSLSLFLSLSSYLYLFFISLFLSLYLLRYLLIRNFLLLRGRLIFGGTRTSII
jgi:hypothetical protein